MKTFLPLSFFAVCLLAGCDNTTTQTTTQTATTETTTENTVSTAPSDAPSEPARAFARGLHLVPGMGAVSLTANGQKFAANLSYGNATPFEGIKEQKVEIKAFGADGKQVGGTVPVDLDDGEDITILLTGVPGDVSLLPFEHKNHGVATGKAKIAFVHAAKALPGVDVKVDGKSFRKNVKYRVATDYETFAPGRHVMQVSYDKSLAPVEVQIEQPTVITQDTEGNVLAVEQPTPITQKVAREGILTLTEEMDLQPGKVYSVAVFHDEKRLPKLRLLEDKFVPTLSRAKPAER
jgi:hypothetical protein